MKREINWQSNAVVYHLYVRSFKDSNNDGIGDLQGIINKLDYLDDTMDVDAIWLSPIYPSPQVDFGYDISDYKNINSIFGTLEIFDELIKEAHKHTIKIMMDYVPNHTSDQHTWFQESKSSKDNAKRNWYIWADPKSDGSAPNNWLSHFGGSAWTFDPTTQQYYLHLFNKHQPDLNWRNPFVEKEMLSVLRFWMDRGVDGFRVDVPYVIYKDLYFQDEPLNPNYTEGNHDPFDMLLHTKTLWQPEFFQLMKKFSKTLQEYKGKFMVTETWTDLSGLIKTYAAAGWKYFQPFNFSLITLPWKADIHKKYIDEYVKILGDIYIPCWVLGNHDKHRVASRIGEKQARIAAMLQLMLPGFPFIYYGEEIGMLNGILPKEKIMDPYEIMSPGLGLGRDPERTPLQWDTSQNAGFTDKTPWLPINEDYKTTNIETELNKPHSSLSLYKKLIKLRKENIILAEGKYIPLSQPTENVFSFMREKDDKKILVLLNFDEKDKKISLNLKFAKILCSATMEKNNAVIDLTNCTLKGNEGYIIEL